MSEEEQRRLFEARQIQNEADREREELALLEARRLMEKVKWNEFSHKTRPNNR